jgi:hypothetical protein
MVMSVTPSSSERMEVCERTGARMSQIERKKRREERKERTWMRVSVAKSTEAVASSRRKILDLRTSPRL